MDWRPFGGIDKYTKRGALMPRLKCLIATQHEIEGLAKYFPQKITLVQSHEDYKIAMITIKQRRHHANTKFSVPAYMEKK